MLFHCYGRKLTNAEMVGPLVALPFFMASRLIGAYPKAKIEQWIDTTV